MTQLDERARAAATGLQNTVATDGQLPTTSRRGPIIAFAALVVLAVITGFVALRPSDHATKVTSNPGEVPRFIIDPAPLGMKATGAADLPLPSAPSVTMRVAVYENKGDARGIGLVISNLPDGAQGPGLLPADVQVQGHDASVQQTGSQLDIAWRDGDQLITIVGHHLDQDAVVAAAQTVDLSNVAIGTPPSGLTLTARVSDASFQGGIGTLSRFNTVGHAVGYQSESSSITISSAAVDDELAAVLRFLALDDPQPIEIRGHAGSISEQGTTDLTLVVTWPETPGVVTSVTATGIDKAQLLDAITHVREATDDEWRVLTAMTAANSSASTFSTTGTLIADAPTGAIATKTGALGSAVYTAWIDSWQNPGITIATPNGTTTSASTTHLVTPVDRPTASFAVIDNRFGVAYGRVPNGVNRVRFVLDSGDSSEAPVNFLTDGTFGLYDATIEVAGANLAEGATGTIIFIDDGGREISRLPVTGSRV